MSYPTGVLLLPNHQGVQLVVPLFETAGPRIKRDLEVGCQQRWGEDEWPSQRITETYGPAVWAQDGSWCYWTSIYMLNRIIRLQAVMEIITNQISSDIGPSNRPKCELLCIKIACAWIIS
jgi:hypothetical protein